MADILLKDCPEFDTWLATEQEMWRQRLAHVLQNLVSYYRNSGDYEQGLKFASYFLAQDPWREEAHREMMLMLVLSGQRNAALAQYEKCCHILAEDLEVNPSAETTALYYRIRNGEMRNKNHSDYLFDHIPQLNNQASTTVHSVVPTAVVTKPHVNGSPHRQYIGNKASLLPAPSEKATEFAQILERLANPACRLLTLVGPNNDLQKRLLFQVTTSSAKAFLHGACFVTSAGSSRNSLLIDTAYSLELTYPDIAVDQFREADRADILLFKQLRERELLLVFREVERYRDDVNLLQEILKRAPRVKFLVNAYVPLNVNDEWVFDIQ